MRSITLTLSSVLTFCEVLTSPHCPLPSQCWRFNGRGTSPNFKGADFGWNVVKPQLATIAEFGTPPAGEPYLGSSPSCSGFRSSSTQALLRVKAAAAKVPCTVMEV